MTNEYDPAAWAAQPGVDTSGADAHRRPFHYNGVQSDHPPMDPEVAAAEAAREHAPVNQVSPDQTGPLAAPQGAHMPAGWVSPAEHERVERERAAQELACEQEDAARAAREQAITEHIARKRAAQEPPAAVEPEAAE
jgi:hypothetical protein